MQFVLCIPLTDSAARFVRQDETPLFQASRDGSYQACKLLLDHYANRDITDHMDRLPRDVAAERLHHDIVRLLDEHVTMSPQVGAVSRGEGKSLMVRSECLGQICACQRLMLMENKHSALHFQSRVCIRFH